MRIHIPFPPSILRDGIPSAPADSPMVKIGGDLVMLELQGKLDCEGDSSGRVIGVLGLERMDKPTLYLGAHHLLHGKIVNLPRPLAVIRRAVDIQDDDTDNEDEDAADEDSPVEDGENGQPPAPHDFRTPSRPDAVQPLDSSPPRPSPTPSRPTASSSALPGRLQLPASSPTGLGAAAQSFSSSPIGPPTQARDYSSDLSSPIKPAIPPRSKRKRTHDAMEKSTRRGQTGKIPRTRQYEVIGVIRKKVVFGLRPEPIVHATALPD